MYASRAVSLLSYNELEDPKPAHSLPLLVSFAEAEERGGVFFLLSEIFSWFNTTGRNLPWNIPFAQLKITMFNVTTQLKPCFCAMLVLHNHISKRTIGKKLFMDLFLCQIKPCS